MKTYTLLISIVLLISSVACKKETNAQKPLEKIILINLNKPDTLYKYSFGYFGDEEGIAIVKQPKHYAISEIENKQWEERVFQYKPQNNYTGSDTVIVETYKGGNSGEKANLINKTIFIFRVSY